MLITYIPPKSGSSTREMAIQKGKYIIGYMSRYFHDWEGQTACSEHEEVNLEVQSEETNQEYTIQQVSKDRLRGLEWTIFQMGKPIGRIETPNGSSKKHRIIAVLLDHEPIKVEATWKKTGRINKKGSTAIKGFFQHKIHIESLQELKDLDAALLASIVHVFWSSKAEGK
ncbi:hypothetical protein GCM10010954_09680 [Halobacillus andaensis]|uniref:Uncharacterized protein n=1 Tax=Halobacillus andaensis TaxID=1176239 RepID=A0A917EVP2_HALAA|nr:hypothetical protein [Halobacillus andaensis]MBP2003760.1 hypothetical protein [Halobacillus andaensis]GGF13035.1 hypothetical protein GCM10010954_09680 [Halobacillus andaensis]